MADVYCDQCRMQLNELSNTGYLLRASEISNIDGQLRKVTIWDLRRYDGRRVIHADSGRMAQSPDGTDLLMTLYDGEILDFSTVEPTRVEVTAFHSNVVNIRDVQDAFERSESQIERGDRERSGCELLDGITEGSWALDEATQRREQLTRRDLRHLMGLPPPAAPTRSTAAGISTALRQVAWRAARTRTDPAAPDRGCAIGTATGTAGCAGPRHRGDATSQGLPQPAQRHC